MNRTSFERIFNHIKNNGTFNPVEYMLDVEGFDDINAFYARSSDEEIITHEGLNYFVKQNWDQKITYNLIWKEAKRRGMK